MGTIKLPQVEIDVFNHNDIPVAIDQAIKYGCPALVVPPNLLMMANLARGMRLGQFKLIVAIDWPDGDHYEAQKFIGVPKDALAADGYEVMLTARAPHEVANEIKHLSKFFRNYFNQITEFRPVLGVYHPQRTAEHYRSMCVGLSAIPAPTLVRLSHLTNLPHDACVTADERHMDCIGRAREAGSYRLKISGDISYGTLGKVKADKYAVNVRQLTTMVTAFEEDVKKLAAAEYRDKSIPVGAIVDAIGA